VKAGLAGIGALLAAAIAIQVVRDRWYLTPGDDLASVLYVRSPEAMRRLSLPFSAVAADLDWIRAVQHYGGDHRTDVPKKYELLYPLLDRTTTLDPRFNIAYRFGAIFLAEPNPLGAGRPDLAIRLLEKGIAATGRWEYYQDIGFIYYWLLHDYKAAAAWFQRGAEVPGAPWWLRSLAATTLARGGDRSTSRGLWRQILETSDNDFLRTQAELRLTQLDAMDQIDQLEAIVNRYRAMMGRLPGSWRALERAGLLRSYGPPADPTGEAYQLDTDTGRVVLSPSSRLHPLPTEPPRAAAQP
jgi:hypothetical protein